MKYLQVLALCIALLIRPAHANPRYWGIDHLGGARYPKVLVESHPDGFAAGIFTQREIFGDAFPVIDELLSKKRVPLVRYNLRWSDSHTFTRADFPRIVEEARRFVPLVNKYPQVGCQFSGATEHQLPATQAEELSRLVLAVIPERCVYVNNPWTPRGAFIRPGPRVINEVHGKDAQKPRIGGRYNFSFDGSDAFDVNVTGIKTRLSDAEVFFFWTSQNNGRRNAGDPTPRPQRKFWPTPELIRALAYLSTEEGPVRLPRNHLAKPKADQHTVPPAPRELKPVLILPLRTQRLQLVTESGALVASTAPGQPFADGRTRYYLPEYGYQLAEKARRLSGRPTLHIRDGKTTLGHFNPAFRAGSFR